MTTQLRTHNIVVDFGKHQGTLLTRVPVSYLKWMANEVKKGQWKELAKAELERRGSTLPEIELSRHAIDRASLRVREIWQETTLPDEGLASWLERMCLEALQTTPIKPDTYAIHGMNLVIEQGDEFPTLKTVTR